MATYYKPRGQSTRMNSDVSANSNRLAEVRKRLREKRQREQSFYRSSSTSTIEDIDPAPVNHMPFTNTTNTDTNVQKPPLFPNTE